MNAARFDKRGARLKESGRGCGCQLCAESNAPRYERRSSTRGAEGESWSDVRRRISRLVFGAARSAWFGRLN